MFFANPFISRGFRSFSNAIALLAPAAIVACGTSPAPSTEAPSTEEATERAVEVVEYGAGNATVVFESGLGDDWQPWQLVAPEVAEQARVFAYSRPGYGQSEPTREPRDADHIVEDLRALLAARGVAPPYVLVGHSLGGGYMELFAKAHPAEVAGLVLVDPRHRDFTTACAEAGLEGCVPPASVVATLPQVQIDELESYAQTSEEVRAHGTFGGYPVRVLTATSHGLSPEAEALWQSMLGEIAGEAADGEQMVFSGAGHYLQVERAHEVSQVILNIATAAKD
jgi:pimeloyl-ACP methyl ester carboxylesterase